MRLRLCLSLEQGQALTTKGSIICVPGLSGSFEFDFVTAYKGCLKSDYCISLRGCRRCVLTQIHHNAGVRNLPFCYDDALLRSDWLLLATTASTSLLHYINLKGICARRHVLNQEVPSTIDI